jgi:hypothetical protein
MHHIKKPQFTYHISDNKKIKKKTKEGEGRKEL